MMRGDELANRGLQLGDAAMDAAPQLLVGELGEPALHEVLKPDSLLAVRHTRRVGIRRLTAGVEQAGWRPDRSPRR